jgi:hypothetical protein
MHLPSRPRPRGGRLLRTAAGSGVLALACGWTLPAQAAEEQSFRGTLGAGRIGLTVVLPASGGDGALAGRYFYAKYMKDIPLTGSLQGGRLTLREPGGGAFALGFVGNGSEGGKPPGFRNSVGLAGSWSGNGKSFPVKLELASGAPSASGSAGALPATAVGGRRYGQVTNESDGAFEARVQGFRNAVLTGDRAGAARYVQFPLRVNGGGKSTTVASAIQLGSAWERIATPAFVEAMKKATPHELFVSNGMAMMGDGIAWFGPKGAVALNLP